MKSHIYPWSNSSLFDFSRLVLLFLSVVLLFSCSEQQSINISGSTTVLPVISIAAAQYKERHPELNIIVNSGGSGVGINQVGEGKINIGMASRSITNSEMGRYVKVDFNTITIGKDAVVPVVSSEIYNAGLTSLSLNQIASIYSGTVTNWSEVGGPDKEILCIDKEQSRGTRHVFMKIVMGDKEAEAPGADLVLGSNNEEQTALTQSDAAIGMLSHAWINKDVVGLGIWMPDGAIVNPTLENIIHGSYPIMRNLFLITDGEPNGITKEFIDFILSKEGQSIVEKAGYVRIN